MAAKKKQLVVEPKPVSYEQLSTMLFSACEQLLTALAENNDYEDDAELDSPLKEWFANEQKVRNAQCELLQRSAVKKLTLAEIKALGLGWVKRDV